MNARKAVDSTLDITSFERIINGAHDDPFQLFGPHMLKGSAGAEKIVIRSFQPHAEQAWVVSGAGNVVQPMRRVHPDGLYEAVCSKQIFGDEQQKYQIRTTQGDETVTVHDPYAFEPMLTDLDLHLLGEGSHEDIYERLGAHPRTIGNITGINFAVWAPNAKGVSLVGGFNDWDGRQHPMRKRVPSGVWEIFVPDAKVGDAYKYRVTSEHGEQVDKTDPYGFFAEVPPRTASIVSNLNTYEWKDSDWMKQRSESNFMEQPMSVYEVHLGSWRHDHSRENGWLGYRELAEQLVEYCTEMGFTHIELMPVSEHPFTGSWGYQTVGYFSATSRYGNPEDLMYLIDLCHQNDIGVLIDWVPAHFPKDGHGLARFDGSALYEHADPRQGEHPDWGTLVFNYGRNEVKNFLISNAMFWLDKYHIDGLRVDAVASMLYLDYSREEGQWIPNKFGGRENLDAIEFLKELNERVHNKFPGVLTIAEESTAWGGVSRPTYCGGLGFSLKWNMGWMNDTIRYFQKDPVHRKYHHDELTFSLIYAFTENFMLPFSHDEVVHGKGSMLEQMPGDTWQKFANLRLLYAYMWAHPGKKLTFMGNEIGQWKEWNCNHQLQWELLEWDTHRGLQKMCADLNKIYRQEPSLHQVDFEPHGFEWIDCMSRDTSVVGFVRRGKNPDDFVVVVCNFTPVVHNDYRMGVPKEGQYLEIFNSDSHHYAGSNVGNGGKHTDIVEAQGKQFSLNLTLPPLSVMMFKPA